MKKIAIIAAMGMEHAQIAKKLTDTKKERKGGASFICGRLGNADVVLHKCGWGMKRAARGVTAVIEAYSPDAVVLFGVSGGLVPAVKVSEVVIAEAVFDVSAKLLHAADGIKTDGELLRAARTAVPTARVAPIATSGGIVARKRTKERIVTHCYAVCVDMESYGAARAAQEKGVPLLIIRAISDTAAPESLLSFLKNGKPAAAAAADAVHSAINNLQAG